MPQGQTDDMKALRRVDCRPFSNLSTHSDSRGPYAHHVKDPIVRQIDKLLPKAVMMISCAFFSWPHLLPLCMQQTSAVQGHPAHTPTQIPRAATHLGSPWCADEWPPQNLRSAGPVSDVAGRGPSLSVHLAEAIQRSPAGIAAHLVVPAHVCDALGSAQAMRSNR